MALVNAKRRVLRAIYETSCCLFFVHPLFPPFSRLFLPFRHLSLVCLLSFRSSRLSLTLSSPWSLRFIFLSLSLSLPLSLFLSLSTFFLLVWSPFVGTRTCKRHPHASGRFFTVHGPARLSLRSEACKQVRRMHSYIPLGSRPHPASRVHLLLMPVSFLSSFSAVTCSLSSFVVVVVFFLVFFFFFFFFFFFASSSYFVLLLGSSSHFSNVSLEHAASA